MEKYEIIKFKDDKFELNIRVSLKENAAWLSIEQIAYLFERDRAVITKHINNIYEHEFDEKSACAKKSHMGVLNEKKI